MTLCSVRHPVIWVRWTALSTVDRRRLSVVLLVLTEYLATSALLTPPPTSSHRIFRLHTACRSLQDQVRQLLVSTLRRIPITITRWLRQGLAVIRIRDWQRQRGLTTPLRTTITHSHNSMSPIGINCLQASTLSQASSAASSPLVRRRFNTSDTVK